MRTSERDPSGTPPDFDRLFTVLSSPVRREVLRYLEDQHHPVSVDRLAAALADDAASPRGHSDLTVALHHFEIPHLVAAGLVTWRPDDGTVAIASADGGPTPETEFVTGELVVTVSSRNRVDRGGIEDDETER